MKSFIIGFIALAIIASFLAQASLGALTLKKLASYRVIEKLDSYADGAKSSGLTIADLEAAQSEYNSWTQETLDDLKARDKYILLLTHFLYLPLEKFPLQVGNSMEDQEVQKHFIERLELNYKRFKPAYFGNIIGWGNKARCPKTEALVASLLHLKDSKPLTGLMCKQAKQEYEAIKMRTDEIAEYDDIYASLGEHEANLNYLNNPSFQILAESIFPLIKPGIDFDTDKLTKLYQKELLKKRNII